MQLGSIDQKRQFLADKKSEYNEAKETVKQQIEELFPTVMLWLYSIKADDQPHKAHFVVAQCRQMMAPIHQALNLVALYERTKQSVKDYDEANR